METRVSPRKKILGSAAMLIIIGALVGRDFPKAGLVITLCALGFYLTCGIPTYVRCLRELKSGDSRQRTRLVLGVVAAGVTVSAIAHGSVSYFVVLLILALDYIIDKEELQE